MSGRYKQRNALPLVSLSPDNPLHIINRRLNLLLIAFCILSLVLLASTILLANIDPAVINSTVWGRAIAEVMIAAAYFFYAYLWRKGKFWGYWRLLSTSGLGALSIISIVVLPGEYPLWIRVEQVFHGVVLGLIVWLLLRPMVRRHFAKKL